MQNLLALISPVNYFFSEFFVGLFSTRSSFFSIPGASDIIP
jgi:hypothetical protein